MYAWYSDTKAAARISGAARPGLAPFGRGPSADATAYSKLPCLANFQRFQLFPFRSSPAPTTSLSVLVRFLDCGQPIDGVSRNGRFCRVRAGLVGKYPKFELFVALLSVCNRLLLSKFAIDGLESVSRISGAARPGLAPFGRGPSADATAYSKLPCLADFQRFRFFPFRSSPAPTTSLSVLVRFLDCGQPIDGVSRNGRFCRVRAGLVGK